MIDNDKDEVQRQNSTSAEKVARFQRLFPNLRWLVSSCTPIKQLNDISNEHLSMKKFCSVIVHK